jgi:hypothetical protein
MQAQKTMVKSMMGPRWRLDENGLQADIKERSKHHINAQQRGAGLAQAPLVACVY